MNQAGTAICQRFEDEAEAYHTHKRRQTKREQERQRKGPAKLLANQVAYETAQSHKLSMSEIGKTRQTVDQRQGYC